MSRTAVTVSLALICAVVLAVPSAAQLDFAVKLKTGEFTPQQQRFSASKAASFIDQHVLIQFDHMLTDVERRSLANDGIELISYVPNYAYTARLSASVDQSTADQYGIRWLDKIQPLQKIAPDIGTIGIRETSRYGDKVRFTIVMHKDEDLQQWADYFQQNFQAEIIGNVTTVHALELFMPEDAMYRASELDAVVWIEQASPPPVLFNDVARVSTGVAEMEQPPFNLTGAGVRIAEWDGGAVDVEHADFGGRAYLNTDASIHYHATHVAGTLIGSGVNSGGQYKGMASQARLQSYLWWSGDSELETEYNQAMFGFGARVSSNSWGLGVGDPVTEAGCEALMGAYFTECAALDDVIRGDLNGRRINVFWAAGNERSGASKYCGYLGWDYGTIGPYGTARNIISVGAIANGADDMTGFSSWGPVDDGRIKPDIVGPGCTVVSTMPGGGYAGLCGTSMATPACAGTAALLVEHVKNIYGTDTLLPSTYKGVLINTAVDLGPTGPDYMYGHGKINGAAAAAKIDDGPASFVQGTISTGEVKTFDITHTGEHLKVTLVWDDPGALPSSATQLINDIDLKLIDPFGAEYYPWVLNPAVPSIAATTGEDHINNVESVEPIGGTPGLWTAVVTGYNIPQGPQPFSLVFTPDSSHQEGNVYALAVFDTPDAVIDPGASTNINYTVANVGESPDSVRVEIYDNAGWMTTPLVDTTMWLDVYDSVAFGAAATVPSESFAGDVDTLFCKVSSILNPGIISIGKTEVQAAAYYGLALTTAAEDTVASPQEYSFDVTLSNTGNAPDLVQLSLSDELGWLFLPGGGQYYLAAKSDSVVSISVDIPGELPHLQTNLVTFTATTSGQAADGSTHNIVVYNPYQPPALMTPTAPAYLPDSTPTFTWQDNGDAYSLFIAADETMETLERSYLGLTSATFTLPDADGLAEGPHWWAVRRFVGTDSSSLQAAPFKLIIDRAAPNAVTPLSPANDVYVGSIPFLMTVKNNGGSVTVEPSPEYNRVELSQTSDFSSGVLVYDSLPGNSFTISDTIDEGRWYWRSQRKDMAGNEAPVSTSALFILDSRKPDIPTPLLPPSGDTLDTDSVLIRWSDESPTGDSVASTVWYWAQLSTHPFFSNTVWSGNVYADSLKLPGSLFEIGTTIYWRVRAIDSAGHSSAYQATTPTFVYAPYMCGDANGDGTMADPVDLSFLVDFLFSGGPEPVPPVSGSMNCDDVTDPVDLSYLVDYLFGDGPAPCCP